MTEDRIRDRDDGPGGFAVLNIAELLTDGDRIAGYLDAVMELGNRGALNRALEHAADAYGMDRLVRESGLSEASLRAVFRSEADAHPDLLQRILAPFGLRLGVVRKEAEEFPERAANQGG